MTCSHVWHDSCIWLFWTCAFTRPPTVPGAWHDSSMCVPWFVHMFDMTHSYDATWRAWHDSFICVTWLIHICDMTHSCVWHDSSTYVTWLIHMCDITCLMWLIHMLLLDVRDMTHSYVLWRLHVCAMTHPYDSHWVCVTWLIRMCVTTRSHVCHDSSIRFSLDVRFYKTPTVPRTWIKRDKTRIKRDQHTRIGTNTYTKRWTRIKRDQYTSKETNTHEKRPIQKISRDSNI